MRAVLGVRERVQCTPACKHPSMKVGVVVVTHGQLAAELLNAAEMIVGDLPHFTAVSIGWHDDVDLAREEIGQGDRAGAGEGRRRPRRPAACWS